MADFPDVDGEKRQHFSPLEIARHNFWWVRELIGRCSHWTVDEIEWTNGNISCSAEDESTLAFGEDCLFLVSFQYTDEVGQTWEGEYILEDFEHVRFDETTNPKSPKVVVHVPEVQNGPWGDGFGEVNLVFWMF